jgi:hypothetical protein
MRFKILLNKGWSGPRAVTMPRRLFMSAVLNVRVSMAAVRYAIANRAAPMISWIRLGRAPTWVISAKVRAAAAAEDRRILADDC